MAGQTRSSQPIAVAVLLFALLSDSVYVIVNLMSARYTPTETRADAGPNCRLQRLRRCRARIAAKFVNLEASVSLSSMTVKISCVVGML